MNYVYKFLIVSCICTSPISCSSSPKEPFFAQRVLTSPDQLFTPGSQTPEEVLTRVFHKTAESTSSTSPRSFGVISPLPAQIPDLAPSDDEKQLQLPAKKDIVFVLMRYSIFKDFKTTTDTIAAEMEHKSLTAKQIADIMSDNIKQAFMDRSDALYPTFRQIAQHFAASTETAT